MRVRDKIKQLKVGDTVAVYMNCFVKTPSFRVGMKQN